MKMVEKVADVLQVETKSTIADWLRRADSEPDIMAVAMSPPAVLKDSELASHSPGSCQFL